MGYFKGNRAKFGLAIQRPRNRTGNLRVEIKIELRLLRARNANLNSLSGDPVALPIELVAVLHLSVNGGTWNRTSFLPGLAARQDANLPTPLTKSQSKLVPHRFIIGR